MKQTADNTVPPHVAVRTSEASLSRVHALADISGEPVNLWRQHSLRVFGDGKGQWKWSPPTKQTLADSEWAETLGGEIPIRYSVRLLQACRRHASGFKRECAHCKVASATILIDSSAVEETGNILNPKQFARETYLWRNRAKASASRSIRQKGHEVTERGVLSLAREIQSKLKDARSRLGTRTKKGETQADAFVESALRDTEALINKLKR